MAVINKIAAEIASVENTVTKFQSLPETYKERAVALPSDSDDDAKDEDFDPFAMKSTLAGKNASKKRKAIEEAAATEAETQTQRILKDLQADLKVYERGWKEHKRRL